MVLISRIYKSYLSGGLYKIPIRTDFNLGTKISIKILSALMQKLGFWLYEIVFNKTSKTAILIDHILMNSPDKVSLSGAIDLGLSDHDLIYCTRKTSLPKSHKHEIFVRSLKKYSANIFWKF